MDGSRQHQIDYRIEKNKEAFLKIILSNCKSSEESVYATCALALDYMRMHYKALSACVPQQEAKAAFKITLDTFLCEYGMSVRVHEFE